MLEVIESRMGLIESLIGVEFLEELIKGQGRLTKSGDESTEHGHTPSQPLDILQILGLAHLQDDVDLVWVSLYSAFRNNKTE